MSFEGDLTTYFAMYEAVGVALQRSECFLDHYRKKTFFEARPLVAAFADGEEFPATRLRISDHRFNHRHLRPYGTGLRLSGTLVYPDFRSHCNQFDQTYQKRFSWLG